MRKIVLLIASIVIMTSLAGCLGGEAKDDEKKPELVPKHATIEKMDGWIDDDGNEQAHGSFQISINDTNVVSVKLTVTVEDSNPDNSETDEGSDPDDVTITVSGSNFTEESKGMTPKRAEFEFNAPGAVETPEYLSQSWTVQIDANLGGGKPVYFLGFIVYIDQGVQYRIEGEYSYMALEEGS